MNNKKIIYKVSIVTILINALLSIIKFTAGIVGSSQAMISDAVHSLSDVLSTLIVIIGVYIASKEEDDNHQYGHERYECVAAILLSWFLFMVGIIIGYKGILNLYNSSNIKIPTKLALIVAVISIIIKELLYRYTKKYAKIVNSDALMADAWHHRSDAMSSVGSLIGIYGAMSGIKILDSIASIIICLFIIKVAISIFKDSIDKMIDKSCSKEMMERYMQIIKNVNGVKSIDMIKTRLFANKIYIDVEIGVDANLLLKDAHKISEIVHDTLEDMDCNIKHCMVHVNPYIEE